MCVCVCVCVFVSVCTVLRLCNSQAYNEWDYVFRAKRWSNEEGFEQFNQRRKVLTVSPKGFSLKFSSLSSFESLYLVMHWSDCNHQ
jgi:hypothetical protein